MAPKIFTIAAGIPFAETLARGVIAAHGAEPLALADVTIFLPTRRAVRTLGETFARLLGGAALLPQLRPLGDIGEDDAFFDAAGEDLALPPALSPVRRRLLLATLVRRWDDARGGQFTFAQAASLARALEGFLDEAQRQDADLAQLEALAPDALAAHWADVRDFLVLLRDAWPPILADEGALDPVVRRNRVLDALAARYRETPPSAPVIAAGTTGSIPATARLLAAIAELPQGAVVLPGLDRGLDRPSWDGLDPGHPQFGMKELLARMGVDRHAVHDWSEQREMPRAVLLRETLRPAPTTDAWRAIADRGSDAIAHGLDGLSLIEAAHPGEEALAIALVLREALETPKQTAALVTPDRNLARRVAAEMARWDIAIDDSAGRPLAHMAVGTFLLLLADAVAEDFAPVPLLALLKHPLAACGLDVPAFRRAARALDRLCLRGPRPDPGLSGLAPVVAHAPQSERKVLTQWLARFSQSVTPLVAACAAHSMAIADLVEAHLAAAESLAATPDESGAQRLWRGDAGQAAAALFAALAEEAHGLPAIEPASYPALIRTLMDEQAIRPAYGRHPRLAILGPLEARLQHFDLLVLGGLNEGTWPAAAAADPWLSRPMRQKLGLVAPERAIGLAAHDFAMLAAGPRVVLTRALKSEGTPTVASRWLQRLTQLTAGLDFRERLAGHRACLTLATALEKPERYEPEGRPAPTPPVARRPRSLSVTEIETWLRDPYAIYAKHVLKLAPLEPLDAAIGPLERGTVVHRILELFLKEGGGSETRLHAIADDVFRDAGIPHAVQAVWRPRFRKAAHWFLDLERERRAAIAQSFLEVRGTMGFPAPGGDFTLRARADRIDMLRAGGAAILDYKTGRPPTADQVTAMLAPQLPLEAAILAAGGFVEIGAVEPAALIYIQFGGGADAGKRIDIPDPRALATDAELRLAQRIVYFDQETTPYLPRLVPFKRTIPGDYDHLSRVREWAVAGTPESEE